MKIRIPPNKLKEIQTLVGMMIDQNKAYNSSPPLGLILDNEKNEHFQRYYKEE